MSEDSRHQVMFTKLQATLSDPSDAQFFLHTPEGTIRLGTFSYRIPGFVIVMGEDANAKYRCIVFTDDAVCSFPLEVKMKKLEDSKESVGFKPSTPYSELPI